MYEYAYYRLVRVKLDQHNDAAARQVARSFVAIRDPRIDEFKELISKLKL
jgi:hypothetical protein